MNKIKKFRNIMAEKGVEYTIEEASYYYEKSKDLIKRAKDMSQVDLWNMKNTKVKNISKEDLIKIINLYQYLRESM